MFVSPDSITAFLMRVNQLTLWNFRNYQEQTAVFDPDCNVIFGENAQGKTNLLEAIAYLSRGKSPKARTDRDMIAFHESNARIRAEIFARERTFQVQADFSRNQRRKLSINQVPAKNNAALTQVYHTVFFCPEDLFLIREGAATRRKFLDTALCQLRPRYAAALSIYNRSLEHKTRILRDSEQQPDLKKALPEFNEQLIQSGAVLIYYRQRFIAALDQYAAIQHQACSGGRETLALHYQTISTISQPDQITEIAVLKEQLRQHMQTHQAAEWASRLCLSGPHKDDIAVFINGQEAKRYASQGQTRTAALALKLAERQIYQNTTGEFPVLLLDDVLSELDPKRQEFVLNRITDGQVFITCCEDDRLAHLLGGKIFHVKQGTIQA